MIKSCAVWRRWVSDAPLKGPLNRIQWTVCEQAGSGPILAFHRLPPASANARRTTPWDGSDRRWSAVTRLCKHPAARPTPSHPLAWPTPAPADGRACPGPGAGADGAGNRRCRGADHDQLHGADPFAVLCAALRGRRQGLFADHGIKVDFGVSQGSDKATAALLSGSADIVLVGPETAIYIAGGRSPVKTRIFSGLTATDGSFLMAHDDTPGVGADGGFDWSGLKGARIMSWRKGSAPGLFMEAALRKAGLDPETDVELITNTAIPARVGAFMAGTADYGTFFEPDVSRIEVEGKGRAVANVGNAVGPIDYTVFVATEPFIDQNPALIQGWTDAIAQGLAWTATADPATVADVLAPISRASTPG
ncbi:ABC transporter substrate-binding protein [Tistrella bauzanensis]